MLYYFAFALAISFIITYAVIYLSHHKNWFIDCHKSDKPQRFHEHPTPRAGGIGIFVANLLAILTPIGWKLLLAGVIAFATGLVEDLYSRFTPRRRLVFQALSSVVFSILFGLWVTKSGLSFVHIPILLAVPLTIIAVVGVINAVNIIDGFNGLSSGLAMLVLSSMGYVSYTLGDTNLTTICAINIGAILGFAVFNFPKGKIFLGDGGAYFLGFVVAEVSIMLFSWHTNVSPWYPLTLMIYPVWEVLYSMYRRRFIHKVSSTQADKMHFHQVVYARITHSNPKTAALVVSIYTPFVALSTLYYADTKVQMILICLFVMFYVLVYDALIKYRPRKK